MFTAVLLRMRPGSNLTPVAQLAVLLIIGRRVITSKRGYRYKTLLTRVREHGYDSLGSRAEPAGVRQF